ncbi:hypothetical protein RFI_35198 [Reticulomyxa filosa]|uniref:Uncharacterized protein n=1 Tax=Reticulomyxa filosa TaxID=46433 RepID=X6LJU5_RETFI|nr:hypothetical protein RFI_35198 [Reticulomyxa filosa]|eukprot:ETO02238.1 hypothetical protein RFI_35198 [Reticulomyxa filosa]
MIKDALITKMDDIMDRTNLRPLMALIAIMTYICYNSRHSPEKLTDLQRLFRRCPIMVDKAKRNAEINNVAMNTTNNSQTAEKGKYSRKKLRYSLFYEQLFYKIMKKNILL